MFMYVHSVVYVHVPAACLHAYMLSESFKHVDEYYHHVRMYVYTNACYMRIRIGVYNTFRSSHVLRRDSYRVVPLTVALGGLTISIDDRLICRS
jgi:hypothetical protein